MMCQKMSFKNDKHHLDKRMYKNYYYKRFEHTNAAKYSVVDSFPPCSLITSVTAANIASMSL